MSRLHLTDRALSDIDRIERYSVERWGQRVADEYLADLNEALARLAEDSSLFRTRHDYCGRLRFYSVREHVFVGDVIGSDAFVLTVWHGSMDFIERLGELEPSLLQEAELLARRIEGGR
ncbi:MAG: type II toxin-antitoxin system RelE/ParE family toxin [Dehalococcoidia bacterium]